MMRWLSTNYFLLIGVFLWVSHVDAQRVARILYYGAPQGAPQMAFVYQENMKPVEVALKRHNFSGSFALAGGDIRLHFAPSLLAQSSPVPEGLPYLDIPKAWKKVLILVFPDSSNNMFPIQLKGIDASDDVFGPGDTLLMNFSELTLAGFLGDQRLLLSPFDFSIISDPIQGRGDYPVEIASQEEPEGTKRWLLRQTWRNDPRLRNFVMIIPREPPRKATYYGLAIRNF